MAVHHVPSCASYAFGSILLRLFFWVQVSSEFFLLQLHQGYNGPQVHVAATVVLNRSKPEMRFPSKESEPSYGKRQRWRTDNATRGTRFGV